MILIRVKQTFFLSIICFLQMPVSPGMASTVTEHFIFEAKEISSSLLIVSLLILLYTIMRLLEYRRIVEKKTEALKESEERYALAANGANDGLWDWNLRTDEIYCSSRWKTMIGYEENMTITKPVDWFALVHPDDTENLKNNITAHLRGLSEHFENEYRIKHRSGTYLWMLCRGLAVKNAEGEAVRIAGSQTDITERKKAEEQLIYDAFHDALTGLPNRALFIDHLEISFSRKKRKKDYKFAVLFLDLDRFKNINDTLGHLFGNRLLAEVAKRLDGALREGDTFARFGGDEFAILLDDIANESYAVPVAERISHELSLPFEIDEQKVFITASMGIAVSDEYNRPEDILRDADIAMYKAKFAGRACHAVFDEVMRSEVSNILQLETDLRYAIQNNDFMIYYQPIISIETKRAVGFEALLRWYHQKRGFIPATEIIPLAEETGLIIPIENWVVSEACRQILNWQQQFPCDPPLTVSVNISSKHFTHPDFIEHIKKILDETGIDPRSLILEITESCIIDNEKLQTVLLQLKEMKVKIHIDDFGTGYSSLSYLQQFPVNALKIDRSFINKMGLQGENSEIVQAIVSLAQSLNIEVIAEGVEQNEHVPILQTLKCKYVQGYFFSHPLNKQEAEAYLSKLELEPQNMRNC